jgi:fumarate reductase flavoprotein subunit
MREEKAADVVVVGGGLAGLVAAARATELGLTATVLEKGSGDRYLCNARFSGGVFHIAFTDIKSPPPVLRAAIETATEGKVDAEQADAMAANGGRLVDWLRTQGAQFIRTQVAWQNFILAPPRPIVAGQEWMGRGPDVMLRKLVEKIESRGGRVVREARARSLVMDGGRCVGVEVETNAGPCRFPARAVVLADGGFQANLDRLKSMVDVPERVKQRGAATGAGDGIGMAEAVGAEITELRHFYGHLLCRDAMTSDKVWPYPELDALATSAILVDATGRRVTDEGVGGVAVANAIARLPDPLATTVVFDSAIWDGPGASARIPANPTLERAGGTIHRAPTLEALAKVAGLDATGLAATVSAYNAAAAAGQFETLAPGRTATRFKPLPIVKAPFMAIPICAGITYTMGGIRVDGSSRARRAGGGTIEGLYAAGSTTGGLEGGARAAYIGGLTKAGVQGLLAAEHIAAGLKG